MAQGVYGTTRGANFDPSDAEVWVSYRKNRTEEGFGIGNDSTKKGFSKVETSKYLTMQTANIDGVDRQMEGLYQLKLPLDVFNKTGIYNIYIRPKQIEASIKDVGVLASYPEIRGLVLDTTSLPISDNNSLVGYRIEYKDSTGSIKQNLFRIITSNNRCEPTNQTTNGTTSYRFNDNSSSTFLTVTPSSASNARPLSLPYIGNPQDNIILSNTFFNPEMIEIEMTENDIDTLYNSINGNQTIDLEHGIVTTYDDNNNITNQTERYLVKSNATGTPVYEVKQNRADIDFTQNYNDIVNMSK